MYLEIICLPSYYYLLYIYYLTKKYKYNTINSLFYFYNIIVNAS